MGSPDAAFPSAGPGVFGVAASADAPVAVTGDDGGGVVETCALSVMITTCCGRTPCAEVVTGQDACVTGDGDAASTSDTAHHGGGSWCRKLRVSACSLLESW